MIPIKKITNNPPLIKIIIQEAYSTKLLQIETYITLVHKITGSSFDILGVPKRINKIRGVKSYIILSVYVTW